MYELYLQNCTVAHGNPREWNTIVLGPELDGQGRTIGERDNGVGASPLLWGNNDVGSPVLGMARYGRSFVVRTMGK